MKKPAAAATGTAHPTNGDEAKYPDFSAMYSKALEQNSHGIVNDNAYKAFRKATGSIVPPTMGSMDFEDPGIVLGGDMKFNGPQGSFAKPLVGGDPASFGSPEVPKPPALASEEYATELVELYWASLIRDIPFTEYNDKNPLIKAAVEELNTLPKYAGPKKGGKVTPKLLFRGGLPSAGPNFFFGETSGPYVSQFALRPANLGALPFEQKYQTYVRDVDYMTDWGSWFDVQKGKMPKIKNQVAPELSYLADGRGLAAYTHVDELYQAYFIAYLAMVSPGLSIPPNLGSPYSKYKKQQAFGTLGHPDVAATLGAVAKEALNAVWYQKWVVHLKHRPEAGGGIVQSIMTDPASPFKGRLDAKIIGLNAGKVSAALKASFAKYRSYLLSQAFPEGSPPHPAYPTGHGAVAGACITVLKYFFNGDYVIPDPMVPAKNAMTGKLELMPYDYDGDDEQLTVNGELHKLAHNISFGHGIHGGIHWRSDTDYSITLGEAVALEFLRKQAATYSEKPVISIKKLDGSVLAIQ